MGVRLSLLAPSAPTVAISSYVDILKNMQYIELINNSRFLKTIKAIDDESGNLIVIKMLIKPSSSFTINLHDINELLIKEASLLSQYNNILPWHKIIETDRAGYLIRQLMKTNLYDRLSIRPFLEPIEKLFLVFQMLKILELLHSTLNINHGDLKSENFLVTSWNWLMLTDFAGYTKPTFIPEDNPNQYSFYFDSSGRRVCYVAPERFYNSKESSSDYPPVKFSENGKFSGKDGLTDEMDLFSLGCVIGELYSDGEPTFTLSQLFKYIKNEYSPDLSGIHDTDIKEMVKSLISLNPNERPSVESLLTKSKGKCFPDFFYDFLYDFMYDLNNNDLFIVPEDNDNVSISDLKINKIYENFDKIAHHLKFDYDSTRMEDVELDHLIPLKFNLKGMPPNYSIKPTSFFVNTNKSQEHASLIILNFIFSLIKTLKQPTSKLRACELIVVLSERVNDEAKLDRSIPYLCHLLDEYINQVSNNELHYQQENQQQKPIQVNLSQHVKSSSKVACFALPAIATLLASCSYITPVNVLVFPEYLLPILDKLVLIPASKEDESEQALIKITLATCLPNLAQTSKRFWMMSKTFKNKAIKDYKSRLMIHSNVVSKGLVKPEDDEELLNSYNTFNIPKEQLDSDFENLTFSLLTDQNVNVKISLVRNILPLCKFFGIVKTNDTILPYLITYLNDSNYELRLAFLSSIFEIGPYVGVLSFEQYLLPLLIQTLGDQEQLIVLKVLQIFHHFVSHRLINPKTEFNALSIYRELLKNSLSLLLHPNEWIRQSVLNLVLSINENLSDADQYCFLYPLIKNFLSYDIATINWNTLYPCLTRQLSRQVYDTANTWCINALSRSLFWQQRTFSAFTDLNGNKKKAMKIVSYSKNMGKSVYVPQVNGSTEIGDNGSMNDNYLDNSMANVPLSAEDRQWILKLKSVGLDDKDLWKVFALRDYISHVSRNHHTTTGAAQDLELVKEVNIPPRNFFFEVCYKTEPIANKSRTTEADSENSGIDDAISIKSRRDSNSLIIPQFGRVRASLQIVEANVFGELELGRDSGNHKSNGSSYPQVQHHHHTHSNNKQETHKVFSINNQKIISNNLRHSYSGYNPYILNYLQHVSFDPSLDNFPEFGKVVKVSGRGINNQMSKHQGFKPRGVVVAHVNSNQVSDYIDGINVVTTCPTSEFFVTGSELGFLKIWDTSKLEKNIISRTSILSTNVKSGIVDIQFMPNRFIMAVSTKDGKIRIYRIDVSRDKHKKIVKYNKLVIIRTVEYNDNCETSFGEDMSENLKTKTFLSKLQFVITNTKTYLVGITTGCKIVGYDVIKMEKEFELNNPLRHGIPTSFIVGHNKIWLLVGTSDGILTLWDLRFKILIKLFRVRNANEDYQGKFAIKKLVLLSSSFSIEKNELKNHDQVNTYFAMIGGNKEGDIIVWELPSFQCRQVYNSYVINPKIKQYKLEEIDENHEITIDDIFADLNIDTDQLENGGTSNMDKSMTALNYFSKNGKHCIEDYFVSATWDRRLIVWNTTNVQESVALDNQDWGVSRQIGFVKHQVNLNVTNINEKLQDAKTVSKSSSKDKQNDKPANEFRYDFVGHMDEITDIDTIIAKPFDMIVSVDRNGYINLYK
ncbi:ARM repeat-containing protein [Hyphopichia burtonii NRRL Y-1933]|uniref:non-specific serine/threonine protein kinase n=1 Tax=Hyphopichia burtonii NRRL Y-1933 TaxID=984485 RepID=A0A1E4RQR2_9ASCO|nr:ARM repeat-containing protein [Hyphopichia burtonii NRRL Y-1933]ODV69597.1 ARM repeat-containing protein [Hyphopichia burtonii NRRL Y-1933]